MRSFRIRKDGGFTLLEVLIAIAVLAIGVVGVVNLFPVGLQAAKRTSDFSKVAMLAKTQMDIYTSYGYDFLYDLSSGGIDGYPENGEEKEVFLSPYEDYRWRIDWMNIGAASNLYLLETTLWIYWTDRGTLVDEMFVTYIAGYD